VVVELNLEHGSVDYGRRSAAIIWFDKQSSRLWQFMWTAGASSGKAAVRPAMPQAKPAALVPDIIPGETAMERAKRVRTSRSYSPSAPAGSSRACCYMEQTVNNERHQVLCWNKKTDGLRHLYCCICSAEHTLCHLQLCSHKTHYAQLCMCRKQVHVVHDTT